MRIRIHKSRSTASSLSIGILIASISVAGAFDIGQVRSKLVRLATNGSISLGEQDAAPSPKNTPTPPRSEQALSNTGNSRNDGPECNNNGKKEVDNDRGNGETVGNGGARDCRPTTDLNFIAAPTPTVCPAPSTGIRCLADIGTWSPTPSLTYQWEYSVNRTTNWFGISGSGNSEVTPTCVNKDKFLRIKVTATLIGYITTTKMSAATVNSVTGLCTEIPPPPEPERPTPERPSEQIKPNIVISVTLSDMVTTYNGNRQGPTVTPSSSKANCTTTYNGSKAMPRNAGTYDVVAKCKLDNISGNAAGQFIIKKASSPLTWDDPAPMTVNDVLSRVQLRATSTVVGSYEYSSSKGSKMPAGSHKLSVIFTPLHSENYLSSTASVNINVMTVANKMKPIVIPFALSSSKLSASSRVAISKMILNSNLTKVTVSGYAQPSKSTKNDKSLSEKRAKAVALSIKSLFPNVKITVKAYGSKLNPLCKSQLNKCVVIQ